MDLLEHQRDLERWALDFSVSRFRKQRTSDRADTAAWSWVLQDILENVTEVLTKRRRRGNKKAGAFESAKTLLKPLSSDEIAYLAVRTTISFTAERITVQTLANKIATELMYQTVLKSSPAGQLKVVKKLDPYELRELLKYTKFTVRWTTQAKHEVGMFVISALEACGFIERLQDPYKTKKHYVFIKSHIEDLVKSIEARKELLHPRFLPMVVPPEPWTTTKSGGYMFSPPQKLVRSKAHHRELWKASEMPRVFETVNLLQSTPYRFNTKVLQVYNESISRNLKLGGLPDFNDDSFPEEPISPTKGLKLSREEFKQFKEDNKATWYAFANDKREYLAHIQEVKVRRQEALLQQSIFKKMQQYPELYFTYYFDFRGRIYYTQNFVSPQNGDVAKSILEFATGQRISDPYWLKVALANNYGLDKKSLEARVTWVNQNTQVFHDINDDPIGYRNLWEDADEPWQFLRLAIEYSEYLRDSEMLSHAIVYVDGTCNGLQHLSAINRDHIGGTLVNLVDSEEPQDIYAVIAERVREALHERLGTEWADLASVWLRMGVDRSLVKRNVMTLAYGVTEYGIKDQLFDHVKKKNAELGRRWITGTPKKDEDLTNFLGYVILEVLEGALPSAMATMDWLKASMRIIGTEVDWYTPSGFKVIQSYKKFKTKRIHTRFGKSRLSHSFRYSTDNLDPTKQVAGISPNFVHSLDASHLINTVHRFNADVSLVHDSYGCHVGNMDRLQKILRQEFVKIYETDVLKELKKYWEAKYDVELPELPNKGTLEIKEVLESRYFFN